MKETGFTLVEVMAASMIAAVVAGGTMAAFVAAARMSRAQNSPAFAEASGYAQETLERFRNSIAADSPWPADEADGLWRSDPLPATGGTQSILDMGGVPARRCYRVTPEDCDGAAGPPDCYAVDVKMCWKDVTGCPCPP